MKIPLVVTTGEWEILHFFYFHKKFIKFNHNFFLIIANWISYHRLYLNWHVCICEACNVIMWTQVNNKRVHDFECTQAAIMLTKLQSQTRNRETVLLSNSMHRNGTDGHWNRVLQQLLFKLWHPSNGGKCHSRLPLEQHCKGNHVNCNFLFHHELESSSIELLILNINIEHISLIQYPINHT